MRNFENESSGARTHTISLLGSSSGRLLDGPDVCITMSLLRRLLTDLFQDSSNPKWRRNEDTPQGDPSTAAKHLQEVLNESRDIAALMIGTPLVL